MSEIRYSWVEEQVWALKDKTPNDRSWIINSLMQMKEKSIMNAQDVFVVQNALKSLGYNPGKLDGIYRNADKKQDSHTMTAVKKFQGDNNIQSDGQVGVETIGKLLEKLWTNPPEKKELPIEKSEVLQKSGENIAKLKEDVVITPVDKPVIQDGKPLNEGVPVFDMTGGVSNQKFGSGQSFSENAKNGGMMDWPLYSTTTPIDEPIGMFRDNNPLDGYLLGNNDSVINWSLVPKTHEKTGEAKKEVTKQAIIPESAPKKKPTANLEVNKEPAIIQTKMKEFEDKGVSVKNGVVMKNNKPLTGIVKSIKLWGENTIPWLGSNLSFFWKVENGEPTEWALSSKNESFIGVLRQGSPFEGTIVGNNNLVLGHYKQWKLEVVPVLLEETRKNFSIKNGVILRGGKPFTWTVEALEPKEGKLVIENLGEVKDFIGSIRDGKLEQWSCFLDGNTRFTGTFRNGKPLDWDVEWLTGEIMNEFKDGKSMFEIYNMT